MVGYETHRPEPRDRNHHFLSWIARLFNFVHFGFILRGIKYTLSNKKGNLDPIRSYFLNSDLSDFFIQKGIS